MGAEKHAKRYRNDHAVVGTRRCNARRVRGVPVMLGKAIGRALSSKQKHTQGDEREARTNRGTETGYAEKTAVVNKGVTGAR
jgi:hypothetical protein